MTTISARHTKLTAHLTTSIRRVIWYALPVVFFGILVLLHNGKQTHSYPYPIVDGKGIHNIHMLSRTTSEANHYFSRFIHDFPRVYRHRTPATSSAKTWRRGRYENYSLNTSLFRLVNDHRTAWLDTFCIILLMLGSGWMLVPAGILLVIFRRNLFWVGAVAILIETALVVLFKEYYPLPRPAILLPNVYLVEALYHNSFPSGDTAMAFAVVWTLKNHVHRLLRIALIGYALLIAYERIYLGAHFPMDVVAGAVIGVFAVFLARKLFTRRPSKKMSGLETEPLRQAA